MENEKKIIDLGLIVSRLKQRRKLYITTLCLTFVLSCVYILPFPRTYTTTVTLAPETSGMSSGGSLSSIAASFGFDLGSMASVDAIYPELYPDVMGSNQFKTGLYDIPVTTIDGSLTCTYYEYLKDHQKACIWMIPYYKLRNWVSGLMDSSSATATSADGPSVTYPEHFFVSKREFSILDQMGRIISCDVDKKTDVITISVEDQDPLISAVMADSVRVHLQNYITAYRTTKARHDLEYYEELLQNAQYEYEDAVKAYDHYADTHMQTNSQAIRSQLEKLQSEVEMKQQIISTLNVQLQTAQARVLERTPSFITIQSSSVPIKPTGPKRMIFVAAMMFLAFMVCTVVTFRDYFV